MNRTIRAALICALTAATSAATASPPADLLAATHQTAAEAEIQRGCMNALQRERRTWLGKPMTMDLGVRRPKDGDVTARCRLTVRTGSAEGPMLTEYTVLLRVSDLYALGVSSSQRPWPQSVVGDSRVVTPQ